MERTTADDVLVDVARRTAEALNVWECQLYQYLPERDELLAVAVWSRGSGVGEEVCAGVRILLGGEPTYTTVVLDGVVRENRLDDPDLSPLTREFMQQRGETSAIHVPLVQQHGVIGVLTLVERRRVRRFSEEDKRLLALLAVPAAVAVHNERLLRRQQQRTRELASLLESIRATSSSASVQEILEVVVNRSAEALDIPSVTIYEYVEEEASLVLRAVRDGAARGQAAVDGSTLEAAPRMDDALLHRGEIVEQHLSDPDLAADVRLAMLRAGEKSHLSVPLLFRGDVVGSLEMVESRSERRFTAVDRQLACGLGEQAAAAIFHARLFRQQEEQNRRLLLLLEASRTIARSEGLEDALDVVARKAAETLACDGCEISSLDDENNVLILRGIALRPGIAVPSFDTHGDLYSLDDHPSDVGVVHGGRAVEQTISDSALPSDLREMLAARGIQTFLNVPLVLRGQPIGLLGLFMTTRERRFTREEVELANGLAEQVAVALESARRFEELRQTSGELEQQLHVHHNLRELSEELLSLTDHEAVFRKIADSLRRLVAYESMQISLVDEATQELVEVFFGEGGAGETSGARTPGGQGVASAVARSGHAELVNDVARDPRAVGPAGAGAGEQASIVAPLQVGGQVIGVLSISRFGGRKFEAHEFELTKLVVNLVAIAIWNSRLYGEMQEKAIHDGLTGLYNHRHFWERLAQEVARARRYAAPLSLLMIDIDDFKQYNDTRGHLAGDRVLQEVGAILQGEVRRDIDIVARYGGEEFAVLLPNTACENEGREVGAPPRGEESNRRAGGGRRTTDVPPPMRWGARAVAERIREEVARRLGHGEDGPFLTVSVGVAALPESAHDGLHLVQSADKALYLAKHLGKDRVEVFHA